MHHLPWLDIAAVAFGLIWLISSFVGGSGTRRDLHRAGIDPRAVRPALWIQRILGIILLALGIFGLLCH